MGTVAGAPVRTGGGRRYGREQRRGAEQQRHSGGAAVTLGRRTRAAGPAEQRRRLGVRLGTCWRRLVAGSKRVRAACRGDGGAAKGQQQRTEQEQRRVVGAEAEARDAGASRAEALQGASGRNAAGTSGAGLSRGGPPAKAEAALGRAAVAMVAGLTEASRGRSSVWSRAGVSRVSSSDRRGNGGFAGDEQPRAWLVQARWASARLQRASASEIGAAAADVGEADGAALAAVELQGTGCRRRGRACDGAGARAEGR
ncbi:uncharacterized protein LOC120288259 [Eucalyptus grandis]|uniref:uncharacterized protein LOC120288259 n=1 Tax=Eucalyptus grandis TaxID=71139 RepID=UPI00192ED6DA|nr:uncharacterized protein LOC120288259 [Eucalyptus grandis]